MHTIQRELEEIQSGIPITFDEIHLGTPAQQMDHFVSVSEEEVPKFKLSSLTIYCPLDPMLTLRVNILLRLWHQ